MTDAPAAAALLARVDRYLDRVQRDASDVREVGPFTLFVSRAPYPLYARPRVGGPGEFTAADVDRLATACAEVGMRLAVEWVEELTPSLRPVLAAAGLELVRYPLLVLTPERYRRVTDGTASISVASTAADLAVARAVAHVGFGAGGTAVGAAGTAERDAGAAGADPDQLQWFVDDATAGRTVTVTAALEGDGVVASGLVKPVGDAAEVMGVATLPAFRHRGLALAVTSALVDRAFAVGVDLVLLSADSDEVARIYQRLGFVRIGHSGQAERPD